MVNTDIKRTFGIELINDEAWMGGTLYLRNLAVCMAQLPARERPNLKLLGTSQVVEKFLDEYGHLPVFDKSFKPNLFYKILKRLGLGMQADSKIDVVYPGFGPPIGGAKVIRWIPDFQHRYLPELFSKEEITARDKSIADIASHPGVVVLSSEVAAIDFKHIFPDSAATPKVWHFYSFMDTSVQPKIDPRDKYKLPEKFIYLPNQFWVHKNHITVLRALARLKNEHGLIIPLVCTGAQSDRRNLKHFSWLIQFVEDHCMLDQVHMLGLIDREDQIAVFRFAAGVIQPSLFEGWSTVVEDTRAIGRPIFLSDIPVHREQSPNYCTYFLPESDEDLAALILDQWEFLSSGPDPVSEKKAREEAAINRMRSARIFNEIIHSAF